MCMRFGRRLATRLAEDARRLQSSGGGCPTAGDARRLTPRAQSKPCVARLAGWSRNLGIWLWQNTYRPGTQIGHGLVPCRRDESTADMRDKAPFRCAMPK